MNCEKPRESGKRDYRETLFSRRRQNTAAEREKKISSALLTIPAMHRRRALHRRIRESPTWYKVNFPGYFLEICHNSRTRNADRQTAAEKEKRTWRKEGKGRLSGRYGVVTAQLNRIRAREIREVPLGAGKILREII